MIAAIITDIEGTTTPIAFVHDVLFPYARNHLSDFLSAHGDDPEVVALLAEVVALQSGPPMETLLQWMDIDAKHTPLKALQGLIWRHGYESGAVRGVLYPDIEPCLRNWSAAGIGLYVYSSGSEAAQRLLFRHSTSGDLTAWFGGFFDTRMGPKREADSYRRILAQIGRPAEQVLFLSDVEAELDAAAQAGLATWQIVRPDDGTVSSTRHRTADCLTKITL
jgi:enolase-phosphatase E1